jgi:CDP-glucose 4,6-dehydratase
VARMDLLGHSVFVTWAYSMACLASQLVRALVQQGAHVTVVKRDSVVASALELDGTERRVNIVHGDICDGELIGRALNEYELEAVFHLAGPDDHRDRKPLAGGDL